MKSIIFTKKELFSVVVISALSIFCHASDVDVDEMRKKTKMIVAVGCLFLAK